MNYKKHIAALIIFFLSVTYITFPLLFHMTDLITGFADELNYTWMYNWIIHTVLTGNIANFLNTNIFYPYDIALSDSDPNIISGLLAIVPFLFYREPIVVFNFTLFSSLLFLGFSLYILAYYLTKDFWASLLAGLLVIFSPAVISFYTHLQMLAIYFVPIGIMFFFHFLKRREWKFLYFSLICFILQTYNNFLAGYFLLFSYGIIAILKAFTDKKTFSHFLTKKNVITVFFSLALIVPIMLPYYAVSQEFNYVRDIRDSVHFALQPEDLFYSSIFGRLHGFFNELPFNQISQNGEFKPGYVGLFFTLLIIASLFFIKRFKEKVPEIIALVWIGFTGIVLSLGPVLHLGRQTVHEPFLIPLPYALFYYIIPGFQGFRNSARWEMLFIIAFAIVIAVIVHHIINNYSIRKKILIYSVLIVGVVAEFNFPMQFYTVQQTREFPSVYHWLAQTPKDTKIIEMPVYNWDMQPYSNQEFLRMYYATIHFREMVNGSGGFTPPPWTQMVYALHKDFPNESAIKRLDSLGIHYIIVHKNEYDEMNKDGYTINGAKVISGTKIIESLERNSLVKKVRTEKDIYVFEIQ